MIRKIAYITIEDSADEDLSGLAYTVQEEFPNLDMHVMENTSYYFVIKFIYDDFDEVKEVASTAAYILAEEVSKFTMTLNYDE